MGLIKVVAGVGVIGTGLFSFLYFKEKKVTDELKLNLQNKELKHLDFRSAVRGVAYRVKEDSPSTYASINEILDEDVKYYSKK